MSASGKPGLLGNLPNPAAKKNVMPPIAIPEGAEQAFGLAPAPSPERPAPREQAAPVPEAPAYEPERSKTFFLPMSVCERLEMQKLSERREMKYIVRQALEEYFRKNPIRDAVREVFRA